RPSPDLCSSSEQLLLFVTLSHPPPSRGEGEGGSSSAYRQAGLSIYECTPAGHSVTAASHVAERARHMKAVALQQAQRQRIRGGNDHFGPASERECEPGGQQGLRIRAHARDPGA